MANPKSRNKKIYRMFKGSVYNTLCQIERSILPCLSKRVVKFKDAVNYNYVFHFPGTMSDVYFKLNKDQVTNIGFITNETAEPWPSQWKFHFMHKLNKYR